MNKLDKVHVDNCLSATMSIIGIYAGLSHNCENEIIILFIIYYLNDLKKKITKDFIIHHFLGIGLSCMALYIKYNNLVTDNQRQILLNLEITTPFYILSFYFDKAKVLFFISFFYCRIYMQYKLLNDYRTYNEMSMQLTYFLYMMYCGLFALNLYWFMIMIKQISKPFKDTKYIFCHKIIPFIRPIQLNFQVNLLNFYSTLSTYLYHDDIYTAIMNDTSMENYNSPQTMVHSFVNSIVSISSIEPCYYKYSIPLHLSKFIFNLNEVIPIGIDTCFYFSTDALFVYYIFILVYVMKPFYNLNPMALHILLLLLRSYKKI